MKEIIYIRLLNEDLDVWRPVIAERRGLNTFVILDGEENLISSDEVWEFIPGQVVVVEEKESNGDKILVAILLMQ